MAFVVSGYEGELLKLSRRDDPAGITPRLHYASRARIRDPETADVLDALWRLVERYEHSH